MADAWRALGDELTIAGDAAGADAAYAQNIKASTKDPTPADGGGGAVREPIPASRSPAARASEEIPHGCRRTAHVGGSRRAAAALRRRRDAAGALPRTCAELQRPRGINYAIVLHRQNKPAAALREVDRLLANDPRNPGYNNLKAAILARSANWTTRLKSTPGYSPSHPAQPKIWMSYGHALKTKGREARQYRRLQQEHRIAAQSGGGLLESGQPENGAFRAG